MAELDPSTPDLEVREIHERLVAIGREVLLNAPQLFIDVDVEADGIAGHGSMLSIGGVSPDNQQFYVELKPLSDLYVPSQRAFCETHGLQRERLLIEGVDPLGAIKQHVDWVNGLAETANKEPVLSAYNAAFDFSLINLYCIKAGIENPYDLVPFDLQSKAMALTGNWDWDATTKKRLPRILLPERKFTHIAIEDSVYQQELHCALIGLEMELQRSTALDRLGFKLD